MIEINRNPSRRELLLFGLLLAVFTIVAGLVARWGWGAPAAARWIWIGGGALSLVHLAIPPLRRFIYLAWMMGAFPIGWVISHALLAFVYFGVVTPIGVGLRLAGYDPLARRPDPTKTNSTWEKWSAPADRERYFRQF